MLSYYIIMVYILKEVKSMAKKKKLAGHVLILSFVPAVSEDADLLIA
jgi:hypothetical protein